MFSIISELLNIEGILTDSMRSVIKQGNFKEVYRGKTKDGDFILEENKLPLSDLLVIGYDKDLDKNLFEWIAAYEQKRETEDFSVYSLPLSEVINRLGSKIYPVQVPGSKLTLPCLDPQIELIELPFEKETVFLFSSADYKLTIPTELASMAYIPADEDISETIAFQLDDLFEYEVDEDAIKNFNLKGMITLPFALFTGGKLGNSKYVSTAESLNLMVVAQQDFVSANQRDFSLQERINHASKFVKKYLPLL